MPIQFSPVIPADARQMGSALAVKSLPLTQLGNRASPIVVFDDFRVRGNPFGPHPHAGFSAVTYLFEDSPSRGRSRDSLGNDIVIGPGGIVWTQAGSGLMHHELCADVTGELHGLQVFVNLSAKSKHSAPQVFQLDGQDVPEWNNQHGDRVRVMVGRYGAVASPLTPIEPCDFYDVELKQRIDIELRAAHNALLYVVTGSIEVRAEDHRQQLTAAQSLAIGGDGGKVTIEAIEAARVIVLSGAEIREPVVSHGPFIMNRASEIDAAIERYQAGAMGNLV